jgi:hypothetical protein
MRAAIEGNRADRSAGIDAQKRRLAVDLGADEQVILRGANERKRNVLEAARLQRRRPGAGERGQAESSAKQESESFARAEERKMSKHGRDDSTPA